MALNALVGGSTECGPANPLQGLTKRFDQDRGLQQVRRFERLTSGFSDGPNSAFHLPITHGYVLGLFWCIW